MFTVSICFGSSGEIIWPGCCTPICEDGLEPDPDGNGYLCNGEDPSHDGAWRAGENGAMPGLIMPGTFLLGAKYCQEQAPEDGAVDRGENVEMGIELTVPAGSFTNCVMVVDTNPADDPPVCNEEEGDEKIYCPGVGLVQDEDLELVEYGYEYSWALQR